MNVINSFAIKNPCKRILWKIPIKTCLFSVKNPSSKVALDIISKMVPENAFILGNGEPFVLGNGEYFLLNK